MTVGTKTVLFGVHAFWCHWLFVAWAWKKLYGTWPRGWRTWLAIFVHDLGYWGRRDIDGEEGKWHPVLGAWICDSIERRRFNLHGRHPRYIAAELAAQMDFPYTMPSLMSPTAQLSLYHSRWMARSLGQYVSKLCAPDKLASALYPRWLYLMLARLSGELEEYMLNARSPGGRAAGISVESHEAWFDSMAAYMRRTAWELAYPRASREVAQRPRIQEGY